MERLRRDISKVRRSLAKLQQAAASFRPDGSAPQLEVPGFPKSNEASRSDHQMATAEWTACFCTLLHSYLVHHGFTSEPHSLNHSYTSHTSTSSLSFRPSTSSGSRFAPQLQLSGVQKVDAPIDSATRRALDSPSRVPSRLKRFLRGRADPSNLYEASATSSQSSTARSEQSVSQFSTSAGAYSASPSQSPRDSGGGELRGTESGLDDATKVELTPIGLEGRGLSIQEATAQCRSCCLSSFITLTGVISELQQVLLHRKSKLQELSEEVSEKKAEALSLKKENDNLKQLLFKRSTDVSMAKELEMLRNALGKCMEQTAAQREKVAAQAVEIKELKARLERGQIHASSAGSAANLELMTPR